MRRLHVRRTMAAPAAAVWPVLADIDRWPAWGPSVTGAELDDGGHELTLGATGRVTVVGGITLRFAVTELTPGRSWAWSVGGVPATDHRVDPIDERTCTVAFGVPAPAMPYLVVCQVALRRLARLVAP